MGVKRALLNPRLMMRPMQILSPEPRQAPYGLRAMTMVARAAEGGLAPPHRAMLAAVQKLLTETALDIDSLPDIEPEELARQFEGQPELSRQLVRGMVLLSLAAGPASEVQLALVNAFASALAVDEPAVRTIERLTAKQLLLFRYDMYRRGNIGDYLRNHYRQYGGIIGAMKAMLGFKGMIEDTALAARFHALEELPEDTLGFQLHHFYTEYGFTFPGEKGGSRWEACSTTSRMSSRAMVHRRKGRCSMPHFRPATGARTMPSTR